MPMYAALPRKQCHHGAAITEIISSFFFCIRYMQNPFLEKELLLSSTLSALSPLEKFNELVSFHKWTLELGLVAL